MKKLFLLLSALLLFCKTQAQISDTDARLLYEQAEDAYNKTDYLAAANITLNLSSKMGRYIPKVLYLNLKSVYKNYTETNQSSDGVITKSYSAYEMHYNNCRTFFELVNKSTYPPEKYKEIQVIQAYFKGKMDEYAYQKELKPQDAVDFLNECAKKFPRYFSYKVIEENFRLDSCILKIILKFKHNINDKDFINAVYFIDFSKVIGITNEKTDNSRGGSNYELVGDEISQTDDRGNTWTGLSAMVKGDETSVSSEIAFSHWKHYNIPIVQKNSQHPFFFDPYSTEFQQGNYFERIKNVYQYLIDYFPKQGEEKNTNKPKSKF